jgi:hypothetical protein
MAAMLAIAGPAAQARVLDGVLLVVDDPETLKALEAKGFGFAERVVAAGKPGATNAELARAADYRSIVSSLSEELDGLAARDPMLRVTMKGSHRLFDKRWLSSPAASYELVGVVNRLDRAPFAEGSCGEIRFIYRLAYRLKKDGKLFYSRLPMTVNVVHRAEGEPCAKLARRWMASSIREAGSVEKLTSASGPLAKSLFARESLKSVEINLQSVRWPSTIRPDLGGHAEYLLRVFRREPGSARYESAPLENTPDLGKLKASPALRRKLLSHLAEPERFAAFDQGVGVLPPEFLATRATSVAFYGQNRLANRPFDRAVEERGLNSGLDPAYSGGRFVKSRAGYLKRLNEMSCVGCHQSRSIAGFHFVGIDPEETLAQNSIAVSHSAHLIQDLPRRARFTRDLAEGRKPEASRPFAARLAEAKGRYGDHCSVGGTEEDPSFKGWSCDEGFECKAYGAHERVCLPKGKVLSGDPCDMGTISQVGDPHRDRMTGKKAVDCGPARQCLAAGEGFPGGICFGECDALAPGESCGAIAVGGFNECLFAGKPFTRCLSDHTAPISMRGCDERTPCRDDFICAKGEKGKPGSCIPPYFLFQLRIDGHPAPS